MCCVITPNYTDIWAPSLSISSTSIMSCNDSSGHNASVVAIKLSSVAENTWATNQYRNSSTFLRSHAMLPRGGCWFCTNTATLDHERTPKLWSNYKCYRTRKHQTIRHSRKLAGHVNNGHMYICIYICIREHNNKPDVYKLGCRIKHNWSCCETTHLLYS